MNKDNTNEEDNITFKKLSEILDPEYLAVPRITFEARKELFRRIKEPRLFARTRKGIKYYFYTDGSSEVYLGNADHILKKVKGK